MTPLEPMDGCDKLAWIIAESGAEAEIMDALAALEIEHYTLFEQVKGTGETGRKQGDAIFPGINSVIMIAMHSDKIAPLVERLHEIRNSYVVRPGMKVIVTDCVMY